MSQSVVSGKRPVIIARLFGGLGNQLFIYATARAVSLRCDGNLCLDTHSGFTRDLIYRRQYCLDQLQIPPWIERTTIPCRRLSYVVNSLVPYRYRRYIRENDMNGRPAFDGRLISLRPSRRLVLEGYWQCEEYFAEFRPRLVCELKRVFPLSSEAQRTLNEIRRTDAVAVCVRSFLEAPKAAGCIVTTPRYYADALRIVAGQVRHPKWFLFSDDPAWAVEHLRGAGIRHEFVVVSATAGSSPCEMLTLMNACKHHVIGNGTLHWWGAWLAEQRPTLKIGPVAGFLNRDALPSQWLRV